MSKIAWTEKTWNPIIGCSKVSAGCENCYAEKMANRLACMAMQGYRNLVNYLEITRHFLTSTECENPTGWNGRTAFVESALEKPLHWKKPRMIFVCSMGDLFHESVPFECIDKVMSVIALCPQHTFQLLTKRPEHMAEYFDSKPEDRFIGSYLHIKLEASFCGDGTLKTAGWPLPNVWLGVTAENQDVYEKRSEYLEQIPAAKVFYSFEPLLENIKMFDTAKFTPDWVICGCESGPNRRPMKIEWARDLRDQCRDADVPFFMKQMEIDGKVCKDINQFPEDLRIRKYPS